LNPRTIFLSADHGLAIVYFLQSDLLPTLLAGGVRVVLLTDDSLIGQIEERFGREGLVVEGLRMAAARQYWNHERPGQQYWIDFLRRAGASNRINLEAVDSYIQQVGAEAVGLRRAAFPAMRVAVALMRRSRYARRRLVTAQARFSPPIYADLFEKYRPSLVVAATPGWRSDRYLLREAARRGVGTAAAIVGWDNPSSYSLPGAPVDRITCWSQIQKDELVRGADWDPQQVHIGGIPSYDGYFRRSWLIPRTEYFNRHGLDPERKLIAYAASFITFSPNIQNVAVLARLISDDSLGAPSQLLIRLHPNHFMDVERFAQEGEQIRRMARELPHVHVVEPAPLGGEFGRYSGEDMDEKSSMMAYADVFTTVYSTMVVEAACHGAPVVSVCIDHDRGWEGKFTLPLSRIGGWPTHDRFRTSGAGRVASDERGLRAALNEYLENPSAQTAERRAFIERECTYTDGSAGRRTAGYLLSLLN